MELEVNAQDYSRKNGGSLAMDAIVDKLPVKKILTHTYNGDIDTDWENETLIVYIENDSVGTLSQVFRNTNGPHRYNLKIARLLGDENVAIYRFNRNDENRAHSFILLKSSHSYLILNCHDFIDEWKYIYNFLDTNNVVMNLKATDLVIYHYVRNKTQISHYSPMLRTVIYNKDSTVLETYYPRPIFPDTEPFIYGK